MSIEADVKGLVELVSNVTDAYTTAVFLADRKRRILKLWHFYSLGDNVRAKTQIDFGVGPIGIVAESKQDFDLSKFSERDSDLLGIYYKNESIKSFFAVPIISKDDELQGVLSIDSKSNFVFTNREQKLLKLFAIQFANLINNLKIKDFIDAETSDIDFLNDFCTKITSIEDINSILQFVIESLKKFIECENYFIPLKIKDNEYCVEVFHCHKKFQKLTFSDQYGLAGCVIASKKPILIGNRKDDFGSYVFVATESLGRVRSFVGVPLLFQEDVFGIICLTDSDEGIFRYRDQQTLSIMAGIVSLAIANAKSRMMINNLSTNVDGLTGLGNFTGFNEHIDIAIQTAKQKRHSLSLLIVDIDDFRKLNITFGHEIGNEILRQLAQFLVDTDQKSKVYVSRYGSDEFALVLPNMKLNDAFLVADEICSAVKKPMFIMPSHNIDISVSVGVSCFPENSADKCELINNALNALSIAKSRGGGIAWAINDN